MPGSPVFIFACAPRSGSTWLQRCLNSSGQILIWGETRLLETLAEHQAHAPWSPDLEVRGDPIVPEHDLHEFRKANGEMWTALLFPFRSELEAAWAAMMERSLGEAARREGFARWGTKETYWGLDERDFVLRHWPDARMIYLTRRFTSAYRSAMSIGWWSGYRREEFLRRATHSTRRMCDLLSCGALDPERERWVRYEDLAKNGPESLSEWCGLAPPTGRALHERLATSTPRDLTFDERDSLVPYLSQIRTFDEELGYVSKPLLVRMRELLPRG